MTVDPSTAGAIMSAFADGLSQPSVRSTGPRCAISRIKDRLSAEDAKALDDKLNEVEGDPNHWTAREFATYLTDKGYPISPNSLQHHRTRSCKCVRTS